ncbi:hypothetical protein D3C74_335400 [compost metagenome]
MDHTYASRPNPSGWSWSAGLRDRLFASRRNTSLPVSAQECTASATIEAEPVITAAPDLATAMSRFAPNATITVSALSACSSVLTTRGLSATGVVEGGWDDEVM